MRFTYSLCLVLLTYLLAACNLDTLTPTPQADSLETATVVMVLSTSTPEATETASSSDDESEPETTDTDLGASNDAASANTNTSNTSANQTNTTCSPRSDWAIYTVVAGDTLSAIARDVGSTANELTTANCLSNANALFVGQQIRVPYGDTDGGASIEGCAIILGERTPVVDTPQGTNRTTLGYLEANTIVRPVLHFEGLSYWGIDYLNGIGWIDATPQGDCSNIPDSLDTTTDTDNTGAGDTTGGGELYTCVITITERTPVVSSPQGTGRTTYGFLEAGATVFPVVHFEGLSYWGIDYNQVIGWVDVQPDGDCSDVPTSIDSSTNTTGDCTLTVNERTPVHNFVTDDVDADHALYSYMEAGESVLPTGVVAGTSYYRIAFEGVPMWVEGSPTGDCSALEALYVPGACTVTITQPLDVYYTPVSEASTVTLRPKTYNITSRSADGWYQIQHSIPAVVGWAQVTPSGNCNTLIPQYYCTFIADSVANIYLDQDLNGDTIGITVVGNSYRAEAIDNTWTDASGRTGRWVRIGYAMQPPNFGWVQDTAGTLDGVCPS